VKQQVFDDFIAAAETLVRERVTSPAHLVASGFSNAGLSRMLGCLWQRRRQYSDRTSSPR
jgi:prolyl oligopeptidase PreP (S9A serine peptidase family)